MDPIKVLDHGWVKLRNIAGPTPRRDCEFDADDVDPANAARMSFDSIDGARPREADMKLSAYLMQNRHTTPIEQVMVWLEMKLPIFVARQFVRHRTVSINEVSARYVRLPAEWYIPDAAVVGAKTASAKQGRDVHAGVTGPALNFIADLDRQCAESYRLYSYYLDLGIPAEVARSFLHVNHYTHWIWRQDLHNLMHFLSLRDHGHAQYEAQQYAGAIGTLVRGVLPETMGLYDRFRRLPTC